MTNSRNRLHLAERIAQRLRESEDPEASLLIIAADDETASESSPLTPAETVPVPEPEVETAKETRSSEPAPQDKLLTTEILERSGMVVSRTQRNRISEEFRIASQQIRQTMAKSEGKMPGAHVVMVTSARPGEGKSFTALNLAASLALDGDKPVVLVDTNMNPNSLSHALGFDAEPGLLDFGVAPGQFAGTVTIPSRIENLSFIPIGGHIGSKPSSEVATQQSLARIVEKLAQRFTGSLIMLDVSPCLTSSDAATLASVVGQVVLVVEAEHTQRSEVEAALDLIDDCANINLLLNKTKLVTSDTFGAYS